jgi:ABC-type lipoprotein release transport system permease subunit
MIRIIQIAWRNVWRNWRRTTIASVAIVLGLILLIFLGGLYGGYDEAVFANAVRLYGGNIQIHAPGFRDKSDRMPLIPLEDVDQLLQTVMAHPEVRLASQRINTSGMIIDGGEIYPLTITAIQPSVEEPISLIAENIIAGRFLVDDDQDFIVIGRGLAEELGVGVGDRLTLAGKRKNESIRQRTMTVVGVFDLGLKDAEKGMLFISLEEARSLFNLRDQATEVTISLTEIGMEDQVIGDLQASLPGYEVDSWLTLNPELRQVLDMGDQMTAFLGLIVVMIACIGILNLMMMAVFERTREMGVLAALGMKGRQVMGLFLLEGALIGAVGAAVGCTLGWLLMLTFNATGGIDMSDYTDMGEIYALMGDAFYATIEPLRIIQYGLLIIFMAVLASLLPAWQAARQEPAESLHQL